MPDPTQDDIAKPTPEGDDESRAQLREMWPYIREHKRALVWVALASLLATIFAVIQPLMLQQLVNSVEAGEAIDGFIWLLIGVTLGQALFQGLQTFLLQSTAERVVLGVRRSVIKSLLSLPIKVFDARRVGDLMSRVGADTTLLRTVVTSGIFDIVSSVLMFVAAVVLMVWLDPLLFGLTLVTVLIGVAVAFVLGTQVRHASKAAQEAVGAMSASVERSLSGIRTVKAAMAESREAELIDKDARSAYDAGIRLAKLSAIIEPVMSICLQGAFLMVLAVGGIRVANGSMLLGDLMAFILYLFLLVLPIGTAVGAYVQIQSGLAALDRIQEIVRLDPETADEVDLVETSLPSIDSPALEFVDVSFTYPDDSEDESLVDQKAVLRGVSFTVAQGSRTAIVGPSGSGKSTSLALMERFYEPTSGAITLLGMPLHAQPRSRVRAHLGLIEQDAPILSGTLADNLRLAAPDSPDDALLEALTAVGLSEIATRDDAGLGLDLGERGTKLSGGQRQRLAWARTMLADRDVLLMDEPTSSVDSRTEHLLQDTLDALAAQRTLIVVAHRLSTIKDFDQIVVLEHGEVVATGTHAELIGAQGVYAEMAHRQGLTPGNAQAPTERIEA